MRCPNLRILVDGTGRDGVHFIFAGVVEGARGEGGRGVGRGGGQDDLGGVGTRWPFGCNYGILLNQQRITSQLLIILVAFVWAVLYVISKSRWEGIGLGLDSRFVSKHHIR